MKYSKIDIITSCVVFKGMDKTEAAGVLSDGCREKAYAKGEDIFTPSAFSRSLAVLLRGSASVYKNEGGSTLLMSVLRSGDVFGMAALFYESAEFLTTVRARENCTVLFISKEKLSEIFRLYPFTAQNYIAVLSERIHFLNKKLERLSASSVNERLLGFLEDMSIRSGSPEFSLPLSFSELALSLGVGRTSLYRAFEELEHSGLLKKDGKRITLYKPGQLKQINPD